MCVDKNERSRRGFLLGQISLLVFFLLHLPARFYPQFHPDLMDGLRGLFLGIAIAALLIGGWRKRQSRA
jgi:hypothetical protein